LLLFWRQTIVGQIAVPSRYYYAIENLDGANVVWRRLTSSNGIPSNGLILSPNTYFREWSLPGGQRRFHHPVQPQPLYHPAHHPEPTALPGHRRRQLGDDAEFIVGSNLIESFAFTQG